MVYRGRQERQLVFNSSYAPTYQGPAVVSVDENEPEFSSSVTNKKSRSRSPIVWELTDSRYPPQESHQLSLNRVEWPIPSTNYLVMSEDNSGPKPCVGPKSEHINADDGPKRPIVEPRISLASFERRRSIYEQAAETPSGLVSSRYGSFKSTGSRNDHDGLSLDEILANLEAGQMPTIDISSCSMQQQQVPTLVPVNELPTEKSENSTEMQEFSKLPGAFNKSYPQPTSSTSLNGYDLRTQPGVQTALGPASLSALQQRGQQDHQYLAIEPAVPITMAGGGTSLNSSSLSSTNSICTEQNGAPTLRGRSKTMESISEKRRHEIEAGFEIAWLDFTYSVEPNVFEDPRWGKINSLFHKERRMILKGLSGGLKSGQMVALMGPSGAGKTCLLESISGVRTTGIGGRMCLRGRKKAQLVIVPQYDDFMPQFTVEETIIYGSRMKNPFGTNHRQVASTVIDQLGLQVCRSNNIQRCSGGQRKRVAIAQELVSRPNILVLDEPTSGLDSSCCYHTMRVLRDVLDQSVQTDEPMAIVSTIHQPSAKVFKMFDLVYLLGKTGYMAYSGPPDELVGTIREVTGLECPEYSNPSDFMIEMVAYDYGEEPVDKLIEFERQKANQFVKDFEKRAGLKPTRAPARAAITADTRRGSQAPSTSMTGRTSGATEEPCSGSMATSSSNQLATRLTSSKSDTHLVGQNSLDLMQQRLKSLDLMNGGQVKYKNNVMVPLRRATCTNGRRHPFFWHTWIHMHRSFLQSIRDPILNNMRILIHLGFASLLVMLYGKKSGEARGCPPILGLPTEITDPNNESMIDLADNVGYLFMCIMMITYVSLMSTVLTFPIDIKTVGKEYKNGWYGTVTYFLGKTIADLPFIIVYPVVYCLITWYMTNQAQDHLWRYLSFNMLIIMNAMNSQSFGLILGALFVNSVTAATFLGPVITIPWYLFTGFTKRVHRLAEPFKSTSKFLFTRYIFEGILDTVYGHQRCNCSEFLQKYYELRFEEANRLGQLISIETLSSLDYYDGLDVVANVENSSQLLPNIKDTTNWFEKTFDAATTVFADGDDLNLASLMDSNVKASSLFSFGLDFEPTCPSDYENFVVQDFRLGEKNVQKAFVIVFGMLVAIRVLTFVLVAWKIRTRQL